MGKASQRHKLRIQGKNASGGVLARLECVTQAYIDGDVLTLELSGYHRVGHELVVLVGAETLTYAAAGTAGVEYGPEANSSLAATSFNTSFSGTVAQTGVSSMTFSNGALTNDFAGYDYIIPDGHADNPNPGGSGDYTVESYRVGANAA